MHEYTKGIAIATTYVSRYLQILQKPEVYGFWTKSNRHKPSKYRAFTNTIVQNHPVIGSIYMYTRFVPTGNNIDLIVSDPVWYKTDSILNYSVHMSGT